MTILEEISIALQAGNETSVGELTQRAVNAGIAPKDILDNGLIAGMNIIGAKFREREIFLPEVLLAANAMYKGMDIVKPLLLEGDMPSLGKVVIGTVQGDMHDIGKNLVGIMLKGAGFEIIDLGKDVPPEKFVETAQLENADAIGMSALLTTTMTNMKKVVDLLQEKGLQNEVKVIIGGAPVDVDFKNEIGADACAYDAASSVVTAKELLSIN